MNQFLAFLLCALMATVLAAPNLDKFKEAEERLKAASETCNANPATKVDHEDFTKVRNGGEKPASWGPHALCVSKIIGWQHADGSIDIETIRTRVQGILGEHPKLEEIITKCTEAQATPEATAEHLFGCYQKYRPHPDGLHGHGQHQ